MLCLFLFCIVASNDTSVWQSHYIWCERVVWKGGGSFPPIRVGVIFPLNMVGLWRQCCHTIFGGTFPPFLLQCEHHGKVHSKICCTLLSSCILLCTVSLSLCASGNPHACMRVLQYWLSYLCKHNEGPCAVPFFHKHNTSLLSCFWALYVHPVCVCIYVSVYLRPGSA